MAFTSRNLLSLARTALRVARQLAPGSRERSAASMPAPESNRSTAPGPQRIFSALRAPARAGSYAGDYTGPVRPEYAPKPDGAPDPGRSRLGLGAV